MGACDVILVTWAKCLILIGSQPFLLRSDWSGPSVAYITTDGLSRQTEDRDKCLESERKV